MHHSKQDFQGMVKKAYMQQGTGAAEPTLSPGPSRRLPQHGRELGLTFWPPSGNEEVSIRAARALRDASSRSSFSSWVKHGSVTGIGDPQRQGKE